MMMRINLLPHRAEKRKARQIQFAAIAVVVAILGGMLVGFVQAAIATQVSYQERRNAYLKKEIAELDKQIAEIKKLRAETQALLERKKVVESLQSTRSDVVHLMDQMLRILPDGIYLKSLKQTGNKIAIVGIAQTNARISTLMRAIQDSPWLDTPNLIVIKATTAATGKSSSTRASEFSMNFNLSKPGEANTSDATAAGTKK